MSQGTKAALDDLKHAGEFTKIENTAIVYVLRGWFGSLSAIPGGWKPETTLGRLPRFKNISTANSIPTRPSEPESRWFSLGSYRKKPRRRRIGWTKFWEPNPTRTSGSTNSWMHLLSSL